MVRGDVPADCAIPVLLSDLPQTPIQEGNATQSVQASPQGLGQGGLLMTYERRCSICFRFLTLARRARHPTAKTCGASPCQTEHGRRLGVLASLNWKRRKREAERPPWEA